VSGGMSEAGRGSVWTGQRAEEDEGYFVELVSLMMREEDLKTRTAEEALSRINEQVGDMKQIVQEAEDMFVPLDG